MDWEGQEKERAPAPGPSEVLCGCDQPRGGRASSWRETTARVALEKLKGMWGARLRGWGDRRWSCRSGRDRGTYLGDELYPALQGVAGDRAQGVSVGQPFMGRVWQLGQGPLAPPALWLPRPPPVTLQGRSSAPTYKARAVPRGGRRRYPCGDTALRADFSGRSLLRAPFFLRLVLSLRLVLPLRLLLSLCLLLRLQTRLLLPERERQSSVMCGGRLPCALAVKPRGQKQPMG